jgi:hypothetical protein
MLEVIKLLQHSHAIMCVQGCDLAAWADGQPVAAGAHSAGLVRGDSIGYLAPKVKTHTHTACALSLTIISSGNKHLSLSAGCRTTCSLDVSILLQLT